MKLVTYLENSEEKVGALTPAGDRIIPIPVADMNTLIETMTFDDLTAALDDSSSVPLAEVALCAPIPRPRQDVLCLGMNYKSHEEECAQYDADSFTLQQPAAVYFSKRVAEAVAPGGYIEPHTRLTAKLDYEVELAVIIGKAARDVNPEDAADYIFGYTILNDVSARDLQTGHTQWYFGKSLDGFTPIGPWIVTADEIPFPPALDISASVNGEVRQQSNTAQLIHTIPKVIAELSSGMTLLPGTIIATGTPSGVGMGFDPPRFLHPGDTVECFIEGIGTLTNTVHPTE